MEENLRKIPLIVIAGPTGVGKSALSIELAKHFSGEVINGDSMQIYEALDIGTGKITEAEMQGIPHHLLSFKKSWESYDASQFKADATEAIQAIYERGNLPIVVGGTGLYIEGLLFDLGFGQAGSHDPAVRRRLQERAAALGNEVLWQELKAMDAGAAAKIPVQNTRRLIRALEVIEVTGKLFSEQEEHKNQVQVFDSCLLVLDRPRDVLYDRINRRVELMIDEGLEEEAEALYQRSPEQNEQSTKGIGYKEWWPYFQGQAMLAEVIAAIQQNSRRYAKRQLTWFRNRFQEKHWLTIESEAKALEEAIDIVSRHLNIEEMSN